MVRRAVISGAGQPRADVSRRLVLEFSARSSYSFVPAIRRRNRGRVEPTLRNDLIALAEQQERAVHTFTARALNDEGFGSKVRQRLGWHPADGPVRLWRQTGRAPRPPWLATWDAQDGEANALVSAAAEGTALLERVVRDHPWPGRRLVGEDGSDSAWMLAMHADGDPGLQQRCIDLIETALGSGDADPRHYATLVDRVSSAALGEQRFGTLVISSDERWTPLVPIVEPALLDERRTAIGLPPLDDDVSEGLGQLPYRHLRRTGGFQWPPRTT